jgi:tetratricopeptide (TPR) repeat protein
MKWQELIRSHEYAEAIHYLQRHLAANPGDMAAVSGMARALRAAGEYDEALSFFERLATHRRQDKVANIMTPGSAPWDIEIACLRWLGGDHLKATELMHGLAAGILDGSIQYASDAAGGMSQGLLLYYMAVSDKNSGEMSFALDYLRNQVKRNSGRNWPGAVASYYLGDITFAKVMEDVEDADDQVRLAPFVDREVLELGRRKRLCVALFHDGVRSRAQGDEAHCLMRMRECYRLENPLNEEEWYLARYEVQKTDKLANVSHT